MTFAYCSIVGLSSLITDITDHPAVVLLYQSSGVQFSHCNVSHNMISALKAVASHFTVSNTLIFINNTAPLGAAVILQQKSVLKLSDESYLLFVGNHATSVGGAIYVDTNTFYTVTEYATNSCT